MPSLALPPDTQPGPVPPVRAPGARTALPSPRQSPDPAAPPRPGADPLHVAEPGQWVSTTTGRVAADPSSWMQAVHWMAGSGVYEPGRKHGPRFGTTTIEIAQLLAELSPCRPGVEHLMRRTGLSERSVQYHLEMLRESGLLAYRTKGTRHRGGRPTASEFTRTIPACFDRALGIRTVGQDAARRVVGIAEEGRAAIAALAKKAARKVRKRRSKSPNRPSNTAPRCTPMEGGTSRSSSAGSTGVPPESELAARANQSNTPEEHTATRSRRQLNAVGRRHQLARELVEQVPWLGRASVPRIAWMLKDVSDCGWSAAEVIAVLGLSAPAARIQRPSGFLANRLKGVHLLFDTPDKRARIVSWWRDSPAARQARHTEWEGAWQPPRSYRVARLVTQSLAPAPAPATGPGLPAEVEQDEVEQLRAAAYAAFLGGDTTLVRSAVELMGLESAQRVYGRRLVERAFHLDVVRGRLRNVGRR